MKSKIVAISLIFFLIGSVCIAQPGSAKPPARPEKSKVDALSKIRDDKVKLAIPASLFPKYLELEMKSRPQRPNGNNP
jgi:hypothetical protein